MGADHRKQATINVTCLQKPPEKINKPSVLYPTPHTLKKQSMMNRVKVTCQITFDDPAALRSTSIL
jgi:hypothetical protein